MRLTDIQFDARRLAELCTRHHVTRLELFGSFAGGGARPESDVDLLVTFAPEARPGLGIVALQQELEAIFDRPVDLLTRESVARSANKYFRRFALRRTEPIFECA